MGSPSGGGTTAGGGAEAQADRSRIPSRHIRGDMNVFMQCVNSRRGREDAKSRKKFGNTATPGRSSWHLVCDQPWRGDFPDRRFFIDQIAACAFQRSVPWVVFSTPLWSATCVGTDKPAQGDFTGSLWATTGNDERDNQTLLGGRKPQTANPARDWPFGLGESFVAWHHSDRQTLRERRIMAPEPSS